MAQYRLTLSDDSENNITELAKRLNLSKQQVITNAINTYSTIKRAEHAEVFVRMRQDGKLVIKRVLVP